MRREIECVPIFYILHSIVYSVMEKQNNKILIKCFDKAGEKTKQKQQHILFIVIQCASFLNQLEFVSISIQILFSLKFSKKSKINLKVETQAKNKHRWNSWRSQIVVAAIVYFPIKLDI